MQQLHNASEPGPCAREVLETVMAVLTQVRESAARRPRKKGEPSLIQTRAMGVLRKVPGARLSTVSEHLGLTLSATSRLVNGLVGKGYVARTIPEGNRRTVALVLTAAGRQVMDRALQLAEQELSPIFEGLGATERRGICEVMQLVRKRMEAGSKGVERQIPGRPLKSSES